MDFSEDGRILNKNDDNIYVNYCIIDFTKVLTTLEFNISRFITSL